MMRPFAFLLLLICGMLGGHAFAQVDSVVYDPTVNSISVDPVGTYDIDRLPLANVYLSRASALPLKRGQSYVEAAWLGVFENTQLGVGLPISKSLSLQAGFDPLFMDGFATYHAHLTAGRSFKNGWAFGAAAQYNALYRINNYSFTYFTNRHRFELTTQALATYSAKLYSLTGGLGADVQSYLLE